jgi:tetratricopeptide (TPR) repeat protein
MASRTHHARRSPHRARRPIGRLAGLLLLLPLALLARWWLETKPAEAPPNPTALAQSALPRLLEQVQAEPRSAEARLDLASCYTLLGDRLGAWQQLALAGELAPESVAVWRMLARTAEALGQIEVAAWAAEQAWRASAADLDRALERHRLLTLAADFDGALAAARQALSAHPTAPAALAAAGEAYFNVADYPRAVRGLEAAASAAPDDAAVAVQWGLALLRDGRGREAIRVLGPVVKRPAPPPQAWEFLGQAQLSQGQVAAADASFRRAEVAGAPGGGAAFGMARAALAEGRAAAAETALRRALAREPAHAEAAEALARLLLASGRSAEAAAVRGRAALAVEEAREAVARFREAVALGPGEVSHWLGLARALQAVEEGPGALDALRRAQALDPDDPQLAARRIETALVLFSPQEALRACDRYAALRPTAADADWWRFRAYRQLQQVDRARASLQAAAAAASDRPEFLSWQGRLLLEETPDAAQLEDAERFLRRARELRPADGEILGPLAELYARQQRWEEAGDALRRALALAPERDDLWLQLARADRALGRTLEARWDLRRYQEWAARRTEIARRKEDAAAHPHDAARHLAWARAALKGARLNQAQAGARAAVRLAPKDPAGYRALAAVCQRLGRLEARIAAMEAARR